MRKICTLAVCAVLLLALCAPVRAEKKAKADGEEGPRLPVVMYHHISRDESRCGKYVVSEKTFRGDVEYLASLGYETVSLEQLLLWKKSEAELPEKCVMITFDDGQLSFAEYALPALEERGMCAVTAIVGQYDDEYTQNGDTDVRYAYMSWEKIAETVSSGSAEAACHTYAMHSLQTRRGCARKRWEGEADYEKVLSADDDKFRERFSSFLGGEPIAFVYPYGSYCRESVDILARRGYGIQFTCEERVNLLSREAEVLLLGRFNRPENEDRERFFARLGIA